MKKRLPVAIILLWCGITMIPAQTGRRSVYHLLNLAPNARAAALGGSVITSPGSDPSAAYLNPSQLNPLMHNQISLNYSNYLADINYGYLAYARDYGRFGTWAAGFQYINYGDFIEADEYGTITGNFTAAEYTLTISASYAIDSLFRIGANLRPIYSVLERYQSWGISSDLGIYYQSVNHLTGISAVVRNLGTQLSTYATPEKEPLPYEVMAGMSHKIMHAPFRLHVTLRNLQTFRLRTEEGYQQNDRAGTSPFWSGVRKYSTAAFDHVTAGFEFIPGNLLAFRFSYNFLRRYELRPGLINSAAGLSFGAGLNLKWIKINYAFVNYHFSSRAHLISICADLNHFTR